MSFVQGIKPAAVLRYMVLPGIIPRAKDFARNGFGWLAYLMVFLYAAVRLLPADHPYLQPQNFGRYGIRHVIAEAANRLIIKRDNIDQIAMFFIILIGFALLVMQFVMLVAGFVFHPAWAAPPVAAFGGFFITPNPQTDIAYQMMDRVFAIPNMFGSNADPAVIGMSPFSTALHTMIQFYNYAILLVAVAIFLYYMVLVIAETASSGTPFGRRFNHVYAPLRLVIAVGLLVPLNYGLNGAQYMTLYAAKFGSSLATNAWVLFNNTINASATDGQNPLGGRNETLLARPQMPDIANIVQFMTVVKTCAQGYKISYTQRPPNAPAATPPAPTDVEPYLVWGTADSAPLIGTTYATAIGNGMFDNHDVIIVFGHKSQPIYSDKRGYVYPFCGSITVHVDDTTQIGAQEVQEGYYELIKTLWNSNAVTMFAQRETAIHLTADPNYRNAQRIIVPGDVNPNAQNPVEAFKQQLVNETSEAVDAFVQQARDDMVAGNDFAIPPELINRGWGGAAIWYNRIAMWNGALMGAVGNTPTPSQPPSAMGKCEQQRRNTDENVDAAHRYECYLQSDQPVVIDEGEKKIATMLNNVYQYWRLDDSTVYSNQHKTGNVFMDLMNALFPFDSLFQIRYNADVHPLVQLVALGKNIMDSAVRNLMVGLGFAALGGMTEVMQSALGPPLSAFSGMFTSLTTISLSIGFILYYVLPFMPFMYFFFAVGSWVKTIFEAMVGVPLWALAHLRVDGNGLPGDMAINGYFLIFDIFLRPILTLFGMVGSLLVFSALARTLHDIFPLLTANVSGFDSTQLAVTGGDPFVSFKGSVLDEFFYSVIYTIIIYIMGTSSFKMIDQIPSYAIRWLGTSARTFVDPREDPERGLTTYAAVGGYKIASTMTGALREGTADLAGAATEVVGSLTSKAVKVTGTK